MDVNRCLEWCLISNTKHCFWSMQAVCFRYLSLDIMKKYTFQLRYYIKLISNFTLFKAYLEKSYS